MSLADGVVVHHVTLELAADYGCAAAAVADQANATAWKAFDRRDADMLGEAAEHDHPFVEAETKSAAHRWTLIGSSLHAWSSK